MTENEKNLRDLEEWFKMNPTEGAAYAFQKKQLEDEMARESGQEATSPIRQEATQAPPDTQASASVEVPAPLPVIPKIHVTVGGKKIGAFEREEMIRRIRSGEIRRDARVWKDGMPDWVDAGDLPELETYFDEMKGFYAEEERRKREAEQAAARAAEAEEMYKEARRYRDESRDIDLEVMRYGRGDEAKAELYRAKYRELIIKSAEMGYAKAQAEVAGEYFFGSSNIPKDKAKAVYWWTKAAEQGDAEACWHLGGLYSSGKSITQDLERAEELLNKAIAGAGNDKEAWVKGAKKELKEVEKKLGKRGLFGTPSKARRSRVDE